MQNLNGEKISVKITKINSEYKGAPSFVLIIDDKSEKEELRKQSAENEKKYQSLIENSSDVIYTIDREGFFTYMNPTGLKLVGYSLSELKTENFRELVKISFKERVASFYTYQLKNKLKSTYTEFPIQTKDGKEIWLGQNVDMFFANDDVNITVVARDITEKKRLEKEILRSEEKYRSIINNLELGMLEVNNEGIIIKAHPYFCKMVGYTKEEIEGTNGEFMLDHEAIEIMSYQRSQREKGALGLYEIQLISKNGQKIWVMISGAPTYDQHNKIVGSIGIHLNITDQKKLEKELRTAASIAQDSLKSKELFLANISHEMRTPLNGIIGLSELIAGDDDLSENTSLKLKSILESSNNLLNLIDDLLLFTKIENDKIELHEEFTPLKQSLDSLLQTHEISAHTKGISFANNNEIPEQNDYYIDVFRLHQVLNNLIYNAIKFTNEGGVKVNSRVILNSKNYDIIEIEVIDTGIGIPESEIDKIFGSFQQASNNDVKVNGGTGLGLSIVKEIMNLMGGELDLATSNNGTTFVIEFQLNKAIRTDSDSTALNKPERHLAELKVLIAEDNKVNQFVITSMLDRLNIKYVMCNDGLEAIKNFERDDFGLVLMDLRMPNMDGMEATKIMRAKDKNTPIIAVTANTTSVNKNDYLDQGFTDLLSKPFKQKDLLDVLTKHSQKNDLCVTTRLMQLTNEDANFSKQLALIFIEDNAKRGKEIIETVNNENIERINSISHSMKPSILQLGSKELQNLVLDMEKANSKTDSIKNKVFHFVRKLDEMIDDMEKNVVPKLETMS
jgi:PAS domain S-box-containing protein